MAIDIYISTNGKLNPYSQVQQQNQAQQAAQEATQANEGTISQEQQAAIAQKTANTASGNSSGMAGAGQAAIAIAIAKKVAAVAKKYASKAINFYADQTGDVASANKWNAAIGNFNIVQETITMFKNQAKEDARVRFDRERSGNTTLSGSRYSND